LLQELKKGNNMKIKMLVAHKEYNAGTIIDADEVTAKEFIDAKVATEYTEVIEKKDAEAVQEVIAAKVQEKNKEIKMEEKKLESKPSVDVLRDSSGDWKSMKEFLHAVRSAEEKHVVDPRLIQKASAGLGEDSNAVGGYLVQHPLWNQEIFAAYMKASVVAPLCRQFVVEDYANGLKFKQILETARTVTSQWGGVQFYNVDEGSDITDSKPTFTQVDVPIKQMGALYYLTQALVDDCPNISQFVAGKVGQAFGWMIDNEILNGTLSLMTPVVGHGGTQAVTVSGATPTAIEWNNIYNAMNPGYREQAVWLMGTKQYAALMSSSTAILATGGTSGIPLFVKDTTVSPSGTLLGRPIHVIEQATAATAGQIIFGAFDNYALLTKGTLTPQVAMSLHVKFISNQQTYRFITRVGGCPLIANKITLPDTSVVAAFVTRN
jgi:HK97 family phage major capsid protein